MNTTTAREHAIRASESVTIAEEKRRKHDDLGASLELEFATAHATTAIALAHTEEEPNADDAEQRFST